MREELLILSAMRAGRARAQVWPQMVIILFSEPFAGLWNHHFTCHVMIMRTIDLATEYSCEQKSFPSCSLRAVEMYSVVMKVSKYTFSWIWTGLENSANVHLKFSSHVTKSLLCVNKRMHFYRSWPSKEVQLMRYPFQWFRMPVTYIAYFWDQGFFV